MAAAPFVYRNWIFMLRVYILAQSGILELRNGTRYYVRGHSTDVGVINEVVIANPYLRSGFVAIPADGVVVDIGANIGDLTIQAARLCPKGQVFAVEPLAEHCALIRKQVELNGANNITVSQYALGSAEGEIDIHGQGTSSSSYWGNGAAEHVRVRTLESFMKEHSIISIDLLKMDCEGAEWDILPAAEHLLPRIRQICMEYHNGKLDAPWLEGWLIRHGFSVRRSSGPWNGFLWARRVG